MPPATVKLIWSIAACNFCPRSDVRTCQIKPGKLLSKLSSALELDESLLDHSEGICTCCLADIDMIIRAVAIRSAMKDYFMDLMQNIQRGYNSDTKGQFINGQGKLLTSPTTADERGDSQMSFYMNAHQDLEPKSALPPLALMARAPFSADGAVGELSKPLTEIVPESPGPVLAPTPTKKFVLHYSTL